MQAAADGAPLEGLGPWYHATPADQPPVAVPTPAPAGNPRNRGSRPGHSSDYAWRAIMASGQAPRRGGGAQ